PPNSTFFPYTTLFRSTVSDLVTLLKDEEAPVREHAAEALGDIGPEAAASVPDLVKVLEDHDFKVRRDAARSLGQIGPAARAALRSEEHTSELQSLAYL